VISLLQDILCVMRNLALGFLWVLGELVNVVIKALGLLIAGTIALLSGAGFTMPSVPDSAPPKAVGWLAWFFPVSGVLGALTAFLSIYAAFLVIRVLLRWVKAI
jgi:hypothetical protein